MTNEIWLKEEDRENIIDDVREHDADDPLYAETSIEEMYIGRDGRLQGFFEIENMQVSINLDLDEWLPELFRRGSFSRLRDEIVRRKEQGENMMQSLDSLVKLEENYDE